MPTIDSPELAIATDRLQNQATISVSCEIQFTEFEVNAMNILGLRYTLHCRLFDKDLCGRRTSCDPGRSGVPARRGSTGLEKGADGPRDGQGDERPAHSLFSKGELLAELILENEETGEQVINQTRTVAMDLTP